MEEEIWKDIPEYEGLYQVSNYGRVKSLNYNRMGEERILKPFKNKFGYLLITLSKRIDKNILEFTNLLHLLSFQMITQLKKLK